MPNPEDVIALLSDHEEAIGNLYQGFAFLFEEQRAFWEQCAGEEFRHAQMIRTLGDLVKNAQARFTGRFNTAALQMSLHYIRDQIKKANEKQTSLREAYAAALSIEDSLLENKYFDTFSGDSADFKAIKLSLVEQTRSHRDQVREALSSVKGTGSR